MIDTGMAILNDFDKNTYAARPAKKQNIDVRVPDGKVAQNEAMATRKKNILCFLILLVIPKIRNATALAAMPMPKFAASLYTEK